MIRHELERIAKHKVFLDIDMTNSFHQIKVTAATSERLSVQTPWGQFQPKFVPEGIGPASFLLQEIVMNIFGDLEWAIVIFDNMLTGGSEPNRYPPNPFLFSWYRDR
jgi:hypothetical protein